MMRFITITSMVRNGVWKAFPREEFFKLQDPHKLHRIIDIELDVDIDRRASDLSLGLCFQFPYVLLMFRIYPCGISCYDTHTGLKDDAMLRTR